MGYLLVNSLLEQTGIESSDFKYQYRVLCKNIVFPVLVSHVISYCLSEVGLRAFGVLKFLKHDHMIDIEIISGGIDEDDSVDMAEVIGIPNSNNEVEDKKSIPLQKLTDIQFWLNIGQFSVILAIFTVLFGYYQ